MSTSRTTAFSSSMDIVPIHVDDSPLMTTSMRDLNSDFTTKSPITKSKKKAVVQPSFEDVLYGYECPCTRREFREYLVSQRADEMIDLFETVENYTKSYAELARRRPNPRKEDKSESRNPASELEDPGSGIFDSARSLSHSSGVCKLERGMDIYDFASAIVNEFVMAESPREINISYQLRQSFMETFQTYDHSNPPPLDLFEPLQVEMRKMLKGTFPRFLQYISTTNISEAHVFHRYKYGVIYLIVLVGILLAMILTGISPLWRITIITLWQGPYILFASAYFRVCDGLARLGVRMTKDEWDVFFTIFKKRTKQENKLTNEWARQKILKRTTKLEIATAILGLMTGVATLFIPPSITSL